jgi:glycogen operon protein
MERQVPRRRAPLLARGPGHPAELATRLAGSSDLYSSSGRQPHASVNFVTAHDGFTLADLVTYTAKHNEANGEDNRDGESNNLSFNCGGEGPSIDPDVLDLRKRQQRNLLVTLIVSQGVPMISGGDELGTHSARQQQRVLP